MTGMQRGHPATQTQVAPVDVAPRRRRKSGLRVRRVFLWLYVVASSLVAVGVLLQAFSIAAYVRGAGQEALDMHTTGGFMTHNLEIIVFLVALVAYWGAWSRIALAALLPIVGTVQVFVIGDTDEAGGWINGLHGLLALIVFLLAVALAQIGARSLRRVVEPT